MLFGLSMCLCVMDVCDEGEDGKLMLLHCVLSICAWVFKRSNVGIWASYVATGILNTLSLT